MKKIIYMLVPLFMLACMSGDAWSAKAGIDVKKPPQHEQGMRKQGPRGGHGPGDELGIPPGRWWNRPKVQEKLKLSDAQKKRLEQIALEGRKQMIRERAEMELINVDLEPLMDAKKFDRKAVEAVMNKAESVRAKMAEQRIKMLLDTREVLTQEQYRALKEIKHGKRGKKPGRSPRKML